MSFPTMQRHASDRPDIAMDPVQQLPRTVASTIRFLASCFPLNGEYTLTTVTPSLARLGTVIEQANARSKAIAIDDLIVRITRALSFEGMSHIGRHERRPQTSVYVLCRMAPSPRARVVAAKERGEPFDSSLDSPTDCASA